ncbi:tropomyosin [Favolaschia claudopus]|uniref:Tropomyosin n=1 Tax=Favolaschia claudopus TaxID=2862362 RepID=A0AAW0BFJ4_9AGAR
MATDRIREKMTQLRAESDAALARADEAEAKNKKLEQLLLEKEHEIKSLSVKLDNLDSELSKAENSIADSKADREAGETTKMTNEGLTRKIQLLEDELDAAEKNVKETVEKLRQVDVKAEHFERQVQRVEQERDQWEKKYEDAQAKYRESQAELDALVASMADL